jgi:vancomycin resistance protein YoaR
VVVPKPWQKCAKAVVSSQVQGAIMKKDYEIGYGKPPVASRFTKGKSGNPNGRPRKPGYYVKPQHVTSVADDLLNELNQVVPVTANGKTKNVTKQQLLVNSLVAQALEGKSKAVSLVWKLIQDYGWDQTPEDAITYTVTKEQIAQLEAVLSDHSIWELELPDTSDPQANSEQLSQGAETNDEHQFSDSSESSDPSA